MAELDLAAIEAELTAIADWGEPPTVGRISRSIQLARQLLAAVKARDATLARLRLVLAGAESEGEWRPHPCPVCGHPDGIAHAGTR